MEGIRTGIPDLAAIRKSRGISLQEIAGATKIGVRYLRAIEEGDIGKLPPAVYTRSYIRQYARAIEYDEDELLRLFGVPDYRDEFPPPSEQAPVRGLSRVLQWLFPMRQGRTEDSRRTG